MSATRRAAEEELCALGDERDRLAPQVEEARWHARRAEKDAAAARAERDALQTARAPCCLQKLVSGLTLWLAGRCCSMYRALRAPGGGHARRPRAADMPTRNGWIWG